MMIEFVLSEQEKKDYYDWIIKNPKIPAGMTSLEYYLKLRKPKQLSLNEFK